ncbi:hypothetical protein PRIPAC_80202 [Pristionchus pacificus]|uniref:SCP domain-containing protein n=1 Tax=Pristionchus pacificus TaxID=54126 RepID=A0A454XP37_PRIPA|nr:hypothetical protein PRIPAC_80202 [Pristionchus pacificus]|eukprot:PDM80135.1 hypothetical protein PRIPAC_32714 [Pristionchus pacificus]
MLRHFIVVFALVAAAAAAEAIGEAAAAAKPTTTTTTKPTTTTKKVATTTTARRVTTTTKKFATTTSVRRVPPTTTKPSPNMCSNGLLKTEIASILALHNKLRTDISEGKFVAKGKKMPASKKKIANLSWDCQLEKAAAAAAAGCKIAPNMSKGANVYFHNGTSVLTTTSGQIATAAGIWAGEFTKYGWPTVNYTSAVAKLGVSDATQMAWAKTRKVGCGAALCNSKKSALVVCKYKVWGNKLNMNVYPAKPASG